MTMTTSPTTRTRRRTGAALAALALAAAAGVSTAAGTADAAATPAFVNGFGSEIGVAFQSNANGLSGWFSDGRPDRNLGATVAPGTSPAINIDIQDVRLYRIAFQGGNHDLWTFDIDRTPQLVDTGLGMAPGTSPAATIMWNGSYQIAFQANTGTLWSVGDAGTFNTGLAMAPGTSPSIAGPTAGGFYIAFQSTNTGMWLFDNTGTVINTGVAMAQGTSPAAARDDSGFATFAYQGANHDLWRTSPHGPVDMELGMAPGTSPSISPIGVSTAANDYEIAFQANVTDHLWVAGPLGTGDLGLGMMPGTSPRILSQNNTYEVAFQADTGTLWLAGALTENTGLPMSSTSSPSLTQVVNFFAGG